MLLDTSSLLPAALLGALLLPAPLAAGNLQVSDEGTVRLLMENIQGHDGENSYDLWQVEMRVSFADGRPFAPSDRDPLAFAHFSSGGFSSSTNTRAEADAEGWIRTTVLAHHAEVGEVAWQLSFATSGGVQSQVLDRFEWTRTPEDSSPTLPPVAGGQEILGAGRLRKMDPHHIALQAQVGGDFLAAEITTARALPDQDPPDVGTGLAPMGLSELARIRIAASPVPLGGATLVLWNGRQAFGTVSSVPVAGRHQWETGALLETTDWKYFMDDEVRVSVIPHVPTQAQGGSTATQPSSTGSTTGGGLLGQPG